MHCFFFLHIVWWSRRNANTENDCNVAFDNENPSLEDKICGKIPSPSSKLVLYDNIIDHVFLGYCFASCQQQFATCLLTQINKSSDGSVDYCQEKYAKCQHRCLHDKRTSRIAEANWAKVVKVLQQFNSFPSTKEE